MARETWGLNRLLILFRRRLAGDESGQTTAEYAAVITVITFAIVLAVSNLASGVGSDIVDVAKLVGP